MFVEVYPGYDVPDVSGVRLHVFDSRWRRIAKQSFPTGYRFFLQEAKVEKNKLLKQDLLIVQVKSSGPFRVSSDGSKKPAFEQGDYQRQYYAFFDNRMRLVRLEDNKRKLVRNHYRTETPFKGGVIPKHSKWEWIRTLESKNPCEVLATLVWLSGTHLKGNARRFKGANQETVEDSRLFESVRDSADTYKALNALKDLNSEWVREYVELTMHSLRND